MIRTQRGKLAVIALLCTGAIAATTLTAWLCWCPQAGIAVTSGWAGGIWTWICQHRSSKP